MLNFVLLGWFLGKEKNSFVLLISLVANGFNVLFDYLMIYRWGWDSMGAGFATALSQRFPGLKSRGLPLTAFRGQYLALFIALIGVAFNINWQETIEALKEVLEPQALQGAITLKFNILIRFLALISAYSIFTNLSARMGTNLLTENGLLLQIALLSQFTIQGVGMTTQTLIGNFKGQKEYQKMLPYK